METFTHDGLTFDVIDAGPADGAVVLLLHGFPQDATAYDAVAPLLHAHGLRTLAPHQRGYSPGARPRGVAAYRMPHLVGDVLALLDQAGVHRVHVVGHDWGAAVAWSLAQRHPDRVASLVALSVPHPAAMAWALRHSRDQLRRSWYMAGFQTPALPERLMARMVRRGGLVRLGIPPEAARRYAERLGRARDLRGPISWYRAALRAGGSLTGRGDSAAPAVGVPTTFVWGNRDPYIGRAAAERCGRSVPGAYRFVELDACHWLPEQQAERVSGMVLERARP